MIFIYLLVSTFNLDPLPKIILAAVFTQHEAPRHKPVHVQLNQPALTFIKKIVLYITIYIYITPVLVYYFDADTYCFTSSYESCSLLAVMFWTLNLKQIFSESNKRILTYCH